MAAPIFTLLLLTCINGFLVMAELAIVSSRRTRLQALASEGRSGAEAALNLSEDPGKFLSSAQIGITVVAILTGAYGERALSPSLAEFFRTVSVLAPYAETAASTVVILCVTYVTLVIGELVPKRLALANPERLACFVAPSMSRLAAVSLPVAGLLRWSTERVVSLIISRKTVGSEITEEEVKTLIAEGTEAGVFEQAEKDMIESVLRLSDRSVRSIMVPRPDVIWLDLTSTPNEIYEHILQSGHSRFPVSKGDVDQTIGIVHAKTLLEQLHSNGSINLEAAIKIPLYVHESTNVLKLLEMFKTNLVHMAIVLDEHGTVQGIVTPTDILTGIAGDIPEDEADIAPSAIRRADGTWLLDAQMPVFEVERVLECKGPHRRRCRVYNPGRFYSFAAWTNTHRGRRLRVEIVAL